MPKIDTDTEEGKAELQKLIDAETKGLKDKNAELLAAQKKIKDEMKEFRDELDAAKAAKDEAEAEAAKKSGNVDAITKSLEAKYEKRVSELEGKLSGKETQLHKLVVDNGISEALTKAGVAPQYMEAAKALIKTNNKAEVSEVDGHPVALVNGKTITDFVTEWSQGDNGKHFVAAPNNSGGGSNGGGKVTIQTKGDLGGDKQSRIAAIAQKYPDLNKQS